MGLKDEKMFYAKKFYTRYNLVVAICDEDLLEKEIGTRELKIKISKNFYGKNFVDEKECIELMKKATIGNLIGKKIITLALREGFIEKENIIFIGGIPHAQFVKL